MPSVAKSCWGGRFSCGRVPQALHLRPAAAVLRLSAGRLIAAASHVLAAPRCCLKLHVERLPVGAHAGVSEAAGLLAVLWPWFSTSFGSYVTESVTHCPEGGKTVMASRPAGPGGKAGATLDLRHRKTVGLIEDFIGRYRREYDFYHQAARLAAQILEANLCLRPLRQFGADSLNNI
jgi:hypothetical protein